MSSIRRQITIAYVGALVIFVGVPLLLFTFAGHEPNRDHLIFLGFIALGAMAALFVAHTTLVRVLSTLNLFVVAQHTAHQDELLHVNTAQLPRELEHLGKSYNGMVDRLSQRQQKLHEQMRRTALLTRLAIELRESLEPGEVMRDTLHAIASTSDANGASMILVGPNGTVEMAMETSAGGSVEIPAARAKTVLDHGLAGWVLRNNRSVIVNDTARDTRWLANEGPDNTRSVIVLPLNHGKKTLGVLSITHSEREQFGSSDLLVLESVAAQAGLAISAALRSTEERRLRDQALLLFGMSQFLAGKRSTQDLAEKLLEISDNVFDAINANLYLRTGENENMSLFASRGETLHSTSERRARLDTLAMRAWLQRETITETEGGTSGTNLAYVALPLLHNGEAIGAFVAVRQATGTAIFPARIWSMLTTFTNVAASAFANHELIDQLEQRANELEQQVNERTRQLRHSRDMLRVVFDNLPDGLMLLGPDNRILAANSALCDSVLSMRPQEVVGQNYIQLSAALQHSPQRTIEEHRSERSGRRVLCTDMAGQRRWYEIDRYAFEESSGNMYIERWRDISHQEELHRRLLLHEQLTSMGRLAASVVHEVGNPLQGVRSCLDLCREESGLPPAAAEYVQLASGEIDRISNLLQRWRELYRPPQSTWQDLDLNELVASMRQITARQMLQAQVHVELVLGNKINLVNGQPDALRQVFLNLLLNAQAAMPSGGTIRISTLSDTKRGLSAFRITDTGCGMSSEQLRTIFEPFNSSHPEKLGLGLYLCKTIVEQHSGDLQVVSTVDTGTTVTVWLPWSTTTDNETHHLN